MQWMLYIVKVYRNVLNYSFMSIYFTNVVLLQDFSTQVSSFYLDHLSNLLFKGHSLQQILDPRFDRQFFGSLYLSTLNSPGAAPAVDDQQHRNNSPTKVIKDFAIFVF